MSHTVGCAFQVCLEKKQKRDRNCPVTVEYTPNGTSFTRFGSFRSSSIIERMIDPQSALVPGLFVFCFISLLFILDFNRTDSAYTI